MKYFIWFVIGFSLGTMNGCAFAQNQSQRGMAGCCNCTTQLCIDNVFRVRAGANGFCVTDNDCNMPQALERERIRSIEEQSCRSLVPRGPHVEPKQQAELYWNCKYGTMK